jgi:hypothetical protein
LRSPRGLGKAISSVPSTGRAERLLLPPAMRRKESQEPRLNVLTRNLRLVPASDLPFSTDRDADDGYD